jgi:hypothetical protein
VRERRCRRLPIRRRKELGGVSPERGWKGTWRCLTREGEKGTFLTENSWWGRCSGDEAWTEGWWESEVGIGVLVWLIFSWRNRGRRCLWSGGRSAQPNENKMGEE